jgi:uncharacterized protein YbcC (UPF0753/DUF2309 family)
VGVTGLFIVVGRIMVYARHHGLILIAGEIVATYWPMRTFVHHNPLHGLGDFQFEDAVRRAGELLRYLAVRVWYERELVDAACRGALGIPGNLDAIAALQEIRYDLAGHVHLTRAGRLPFRRPGSFYPADLLGAAPVPSNG